MLKFLRTGDKVELTELFVVRCDTIANMVYLRRGDGADIVLPMSMAEFDFGMYGANSKAHPTNLPFNHPDFCTWVDESKRLVRHSRTGEKCRLILDDSFYSTGKYTLVNTEGSSKTRTAPSWDSKSLLVSASVLKGREVALHVKINVIIYKDKVVDSITLNRLTTSKVLLVVSSLKWETFAIISPTLIKGYHASTASKKVKGGSGKPHKQ